MTRVLSALILIPTVLALVLLAPAWLFAVAVMCLVGLALLEFHNLSPSALSFWEKGLGGAIGIWLAGALWAGRPHPLELLLAGSLLCGMASLFSERSTEELVRGWVWVVFGWFYVALPLSLLYSIRHGSSLADGRHLLLFLLVIQWLQDTAAYYVGTACGKHKIAPRFSPKKSVEGSVAGLVAAAVGSAVFSVWAFPSANVWQVVMTGLLLGLVGQFSDMAESLFKRAARVKDSSQLIPGHGGVLDRIDGLLFAAPLFWLILNHWTL